MAESQIGFCRHKNQFLISQFFVVPSHSVSSALASHDYILKIVPTVYEDLSGKQKFSYQYTVANKVK